jgi:hypothetical protein
VSYFRAPLSQKADDDEKTKADYASPVDELKAIYQAKTGTRSTTFPWTTTI